MTISLLDLLKLLEQASYHSTLPVEIEPMIFLSQWSVHETTYADGHKTRHVIGRHLDEGRVSSAIQQFNPELKQLKTHSGRVYQLTKENGFDRNADYVFNRWCQINEVVAVIDVTGQYCL